jgi:hypothetical protein
LRALWRVDQRIADARPWLQFRRRLEAIPACRRFGVRDALENEDSILLFAAYASTGRLRDDRGTLELRTQLPRERSGCSQRSGNKRRPPQESTAIESGARNENARFALAVR